MIQDLLMITKISFQTSVSVQWNVHEVRVYINYQIVNKYASKGKLFSICKIRSEKCFWIFLPVCFLMFVML